MTHEDQTRPQAQQTRTSSASSARTTDETQELHAASAAPAGPTRLELSPAQIAGSALAAVSSAFFASWAGTAGTLIGVAVGSVIATVGAATYTWWLRRTQEAVRRRAALVRQTTLAANGLPRTVAVGPLRRRGERGDDATRTDLTPVTTDGATGEDSLPGRWALPWRRVLLTSAAVMVVALLAITGFEELTGRTFASYTGNGGSGSTVGKVLGGDSSTRQQPTEKKTSTPTPTPTPTATPTDGTTTGSQDGTGSQGSTPAPTPTPTIPTPSSAATQSPSAPSGTSTPDSANTAVP